MYKSVKFSHKNDTHLSIHLPIVDGASRALNELRKMGIFM